MISLLKTLPIPLPRNQKTTRAKTGSNPNDRKLKIRNQSIRAPRVALEELSAEK